MVHDNQIGDLLDRCRAKVQRAAHIGLDLAIGLERIEAGDQDIVALDNGVDPLAEGKVEDLHNGIAAGDGVRIGGFVGQRQGAIAAFQFQPVVVASAGRPSRAAVGAAIVAPL